MALAKREKLTILNGSFDFFDSIALFRFLSRVPFTHTHVSHNRTKGVMPLSSLQLLPVTNIEKKIVFAATRTGYHCYSNSKIY